MMRKTSFMAFLRKCTHRKDLVGFFAREWLVDHRPGKPTKMKGMKSVLDYMITQGATESAQLAAQLAWEEWRAAAQMQDDGD